VGTVVVRVGYHCKFLMFVGLILASNLCILISLISMPTHDLIINCIEKRHFHIVLGSSHTFVCETAASCVSSELCRNTVMCAVCTLTLYIGLLFLCIFNKA